METGAEEVVVTDAPGYMKSVTYQGQTHYEEPYFKSTFTFVNDPTSGERIEGILTFLWNEADIPDIGRNVDDDDTLFALQFRLIGSAGEMGDPSWWTTPPHLVAPASGEDIDETTQAGEISIINQIAVSGAVWMGGESDLPVINVTVDLEQNGSTSQEITDETGAFGYTLTDTSEIILRAEKAHRRARPSRSVDVSDIVAMRKHILVIERLATVPAMIAADANEDDSIDVADIVAMQKVILAKSDSFSTDDQGNAQAVWRIVDAEVVNNATTENVFDGILDGA